MFILGNIFGEQKGLKILGSEIRKFRGRREQM